MEGKNTKRKKASEPDLSVMAYGKTPPKNTELERVILGAVMVEKNAFEKVYSTLKPHHFYNEQHSLIFKAFESLYSRAEPIDLYTVAEELHRKGEVEIVGGLHYLSGLTNNVSSSANIEFHAEKVFQKWVQREIIKISAEGLNTAFEGELDVPVMLDLMQTQLFAITKGLYKRDFTDMTTSCTTALSDISAKVNKTPGELTGVPTGFKELDILTGGLQETDLIALAARPSVGKTAFSLNLAVNACTHPKQPVGVAFFSLEMSTSQLVQRILSSISGVPLEQIRDGDLNQVEQTAVFQAANTLSNYPLYIDDTPNLNIIELKAKAKRIIEAAEKTKKQRGLKKGIGLIIIDYLQLMNGVNDGSYKSKNDIVSDISRELKILAKELKVPIIELSQMSRSIETRAEKEPQLSDLRESGAIEQDADLVAFLYREDFETNVKIAKHRNGKLKKFKLKSKLEIQKFYDFEGVQVSSPRTKVIDKGNFDEGLPEVENEFSFINKK